MPAARAASPRGAPLLAIGRVVKAMDASSSRLAGPSTQSHMHMNTNGHVTHGVDGGHSLEELERELPSVVDGQVPLGDLLSRIAQAVYAELTEMAET